MITQHRLPRRTKPDSQGVRLGTNRQHWGSKSEIIVKMHSEVDFVAEATDLAAALAAAIGTMMPSAFHRQPHLWTVCPAAMHGAALPF